MYAPSLWFANESLHMVSCAYGQIHAHIYMPTLQNRCADELFPKDIRTEHTGGAD